MFNMSKRSMMAEAVMPKRRTMMKTSMMITGATLAGVGAYASYRAIKNRNQQNQMNMSFDDDYEYDNFDYDAQHKNDYNELKKKVNEFNDSHKVSYGDNNDYGGHNFQIKANAESAKSENNKMK